MTNWDFPCSDPVDISIDTWTSGSIVVAGEPTSTITVEVVPSHHGADVDDLIAQVGVAFDDGQLYIRGPRLSGFRRKKGLDLTIKVPQGSSCAAKTVSADLAAVGELSGLTMQTASGDVTAAAVTGNVTVQSASGDVLLQAAGGDIAINTASGDIQAASVDGDARINTASGDVTIGHCTGSVQARTASGDVDLSAVASGEVDLVSASGDLAVAVVPGIGVYLDLASTSGSIRSELDASDDGEDASVAAVQISCRTLSGDIRIRKARGAAAQPAAPAGPADAADAGKPDAIGR
ncbi:MAG TPA: DUF4097 family beta strand repeat-containing protein [Streptosporangiaceae bacterium]|jgi:hypothetical protein|nr:DUF4097 family beta strand repeat-containing protein [Streptosporangiaceae bacterium]